MFVDSVLRQLSELASSGPDPQVWIDAQAAIARTQSLGLPLVRDPDGVLAKFTAGAPAILPAPTGPGPLGFLRTRPLQGSFDVFAAPEWAHGAAIARTAGPVSDENGVPFSIDTIVPASRRLEIARAPGASSIAYVQSASVARTSSQGNTVVTFSAGCVWFAAQLLARGAPANGFAGIAFQNATLTIGGTPATAPTDELLVLDSGSAPEFEIDLSPDTPPPGGLVNDGSDTVVAPPAKVVFLLAPGGVQVTSMGDAQLTAYDNAVTLGGGAGAVSYDAEAFEIAVDFKEVSPPLEITITSRESSSFKLRGVANIVSGSYRFPVALSRTDALGPVASSGALGLSLSAGLSSQWGNLAGGVALDATLLHAQAGILGVRALTIIRAFADTYAFWDSRSATGDHRATTVMIHGPRRTALRACESAASEIVLASGCRLETHLDRPVLASGELAPISQLTIAYALTRSNADATLAIEGTSVMVALDVAVSPPPQTYVIENAVLRTRGVDAVFAFGKLSAKRATQGAIVFRNALDRVMPILPDPYAASPLLAEETAAAPLFATVSWPSPSEPRLGFLISRQQNAGIPDGPTGPRVALAERGGFVALYDVSSAQSQFGVAATAGALAGSQILGQRLAVSGQNSVLFTVPAIAWEPVLVDPTRAWFTTALAPDDGPPATVNVETVTLRPLEPGAFLDAFVADYAEGADLFAEITLPFGLTATVDTKSDGAAPSIGRPTLLLAEPKFPAAGRTGGLQLSLRAAVDPASGRAVLPGRSNAGGPIPADPNEPEDSRYVHAILDDSPNHDMANFWNNFNGQLPETRFVPVSRYDLSGYGASLFSSYVVPGFSPGISQARFDVIVGRTSYMLVQAQSVILPWFIPVTSTTIFERDATGYVLRHDTGWQAKDAGTFAFPNGASEIERGGILGVFNIHNIVEQPGTLTVNGKQFSRVTFDGDVHLAVGDSSGLSVTGGDAQGRIPSHGLSGYLDLAALDAPSVDEARKLLDQFGTAGGPIAAEVVVATNGLAVGLTSVEVAATRADALPQTLAVALRGTPRLPRDGAWSVGTRTAQSTVPRPLDPMTLVPLVRPNATPNIWHIAEAADIVRLDAPNTLYGFLQATGTTKSFFEHPTIAHVAGANPINFRQPPKLADVGKLLGDNGLLPDVASLLDLGSFDGLKPAGDGFALARTLEKDVDLGKRLLLPFGIATLFMESSRPGATHVKLQLDATASPRWAISMSGIAFKLAVTGWGDEADPLITVTGDASAQDGGKPTFSNLGVKYGTALGAVQSVLTEVEQFIQFLPSKEKTGLDVSFAGSKLRIREVFPLPRLPLGLGYIEDFSLDLGFDVDVLDKNLSFFVGLGDDKNPFHWLVSPLSGNGLLQLGARDTLGVVMEAGIGVGLAIDFAIVSGSASIVLAVRFDTTTHPIGVMVLLTGQASVDVLDGLASVSLTLTAGVGVAVQPGPSSLLPLDPIEFLKETVVTLTAEVAVGIHLTVAWLVHVDFDGSWPFRETISGKTLTDLSPI